MGTKAIICSAQRAVWIRLDDVSDIFQEYSGICRLPWGNGTAVSEIIQEIHRYLPITMEIRYHDSGRGTTFFLFFACLACYHSIFPRRQLTPFGVYKLGTPARVTWEEDQRRRFFLPFSAFLLRCLKRLPGHREKG